MTYNFDPDRWYQDRRRLLELRHSRAEIDDVGLAAALEELERRYEAMLDRLDGSYVIPRGDREPAS